MLQPFLPPKTGTDLEQLINNFNIKYKAAETKKQQTNLLSLLPAEWTYEKMKSKVGSGVHVTRYLWTESRAVLEKSGPMPGIRPQVSYNFIHMNCIFR